MKSYKNQGIKSARMRVADSKADEFALDEKLKTITLDRKLDVADKVTDTAFVSNAISFGGELLALNEDRKALNERRGRIKFGIDTYQNISEEEVDREITTLADVRAGKAKLSDVGTERFYVGKGENRIEFKGADFDAFGKMYQENKMSAMLLHGKQPNVANIYEKLIKAESGGEEDPLMAVSYAYDENTGVEDKTKPIAYGPSQLRPSTAMQPGYSRNIFEIADSMGIKYDAKDETSAIKLLQTKGLGKMMGFEYLQGLAKHYKGNIEKAVAAYNAGVGNIDKWSGNRADLKKETREYVEEILGDTKYDYSVNLGEGDSDFDMGDKTMWQYLMGK